MLKDRFKAQLDAAGLLGLAESTARKLRERTTARGREERRQFQRMVAFYAGLMGAGDLVFDVGANSSSSTASPPTNSTSPSAKRCASRTRRGCRAPPSSRRSIGWSASEAA